MFYRKRSRKKFSPVLSNLEEKNIDNSAFSSIETLFPLDVASCKGCGQGNDILRILSNLTKLIIIRV